MGIGLSFSGDTSLNKGVLQKFLSRYPNPSTRKLYCWAIAKFMNTIFDEGDLEAKTDVYFSQFIDLNQHKLNIESFFSSIDGNAPKSQKTCEGVLRALFNFMEEYYGVQSPSPQFWKGLPLRRKGLKSKRALTKDIVPTNKQMRRILSHCPIHGKALFLTLSSGGMRIGDVVEIDLQDLHLHQTLEDGTVYHEVDVFDRKTRERRFVFISDEAAEAIEEWLKVRDDYLIQASLKMGRKQQRQYRKKFKGKPINDTSLFPFTPNNARVVWNKAVQKAGLEVRDRHTSRRTLHPHSLRKYYRTKMAGAGVPVDVVEALLGHSAYLDEYRRYSKQDLVGYYRRGVHALMVYGDSASIQKQLDRHQRALRVLANLALRQMGKKELDLNLRENGIDPQLIDGVVGGGKAIKSEWEPELLLEVMEFLKSIRDE